MPYPSYSTPTPSSGKLLPSKLIMWITGFLLTIAGWLPTCSAIEESFCAGTGYGYSRNPIMGMNSMGSTSNYDEKGNTFWAMNHFVFSSTAVALKVDIYQVMAKGADGSDQEAHGWLHLEVSRKDGGELKMFAIWALTKSRETFGQFVYLGDNICSTTDPKVKVSNYFPCSAAPKNSADNPSMFVYADHTSGAAKFNLLWKADVTHCKDPDEFKFFVATHSRLWITNTIPVLELAPASSEFGPTVYSSKPLLPHFYGAAAAVDVQSIDCSKQFSILAQQPSWLRSPFTATTPDDTLETPENKYRTDRWLKNAQGQTLGQDVDNRRVCKASHAGYYLFGGRCSQLVKDRNTGAVYADETQIPECYPSTRHTIPPPFITKYFEYMRTKAVADVMKGCDCPPHPTAKEIKEANLRSGLITDARPYEVEGEGCREPKNQEEADALGLCQNSVAGKTVHAVRVWHGMAMLMNTMILIPVSSFMSRFLKGRMHNPESANYHDHVHIIPLSAWYIVHLYLVLPMSCMFLTSYSVIRRQYGIMGKSMDQFAVYHHTLGNYYAYLLVIQVLGGFLRPLNVRLRRVFIFFHWLIGYVLHIGGVVLSVMTYRIPASPFAFMSHMNPDFGSIYYHLAPGILLIWCFLDTLFRIFVEIYVIRYDKRVLGIRIHAGMYFPVHLPVPMDNYSVEAHQDFMAQDRRLQLLFKIYIGICLFFYVTVSSCMAFLHFGESVGFGKMQCTHNSDGVFVAGTDSATADDLLQMEKFCPAA